MDEWGRFSSDKGGGSGRGGGHAILRARGHMLWSSSSDVETCGDDASAGWTDGVVFQVIMEGEEGETAGMRFCVPVAIFFGRSGRRWVASRPGEVVRGRWGRYSSERGGGLAVMAVGTNFGARGRFFFGVRVVVTRNGDGGASGECLCVSLWSAFRDREQGVVLLRT
jgi:hypothetical protein